MVENAKTMTIKDAEKAMAKLQREHIDPNVGQPVRNAAHANLRTMASFVKTLRDRHFTRVSDIEKLVDEKLNQDQKDYLSGLDQLPGV